METKLVKVFLSVVTGILLVLFGYWLGSLKSTDITKFAKTDFGELVDRYNEGMVVGANKAQVAMITALFETIDKEREVTLYNQEGKKLTLIEKATNPTEWTDKKATTSNQEQPKN